MAEALEGIPLREDVTREEAVEHLCVRLAQTLGVISAPWFRLKPAHLTRPSYRTLRALRARYGPDAVFRLDAPPEHVPTIEAFLAHGGPRERLDGMLSNMVREVSEASVAVSADTERPRADPARSPPRGGPRGDHRRRDRGGVREAGLPAESEAHGRPDRRVVEGPPRPVRDGR